MAFGVVLFMDNHTEYITAFEKGENYVEVITESGRYVCQEEICAFENGYKAKIHTFFRRVYVSNHCRYIWKVVDNIKSFELWEGSITDG